MKKTEIMKEAWLAAKEDHLRTLVSSLSWEDDDFRWLRRLSIEENRELMTIPWIERNVDRTISLRFHFKIALGVIWKLYNEGFYKKYAQYSRVAKLKNAGI